MKILAVGIATLDIVLQLKSYPVEDDEVRALDQSQRRGGNATNTLVSLSRLGHSCDWAGTLIERVDDAGSALIRDDLKRFNIDTRYCLHLMEGVMPTSYISLSRESASRTIVHVRDLPEFSFHAFEQIELSEFDWVHFEGRNIPDLALMLESVVGHQLPCSMEIEKPRAGIESLFGYPDLLLFSRQYARAQGATSAEQLLNRIDTKGRDAICTWGDAGAWGRDRQGEIFHSAAFQQQQIVDTIGAGDVFNAGMINARLAGHSLETALVHACQLAGCHCAIDGFAGLPNRTC